MTPDDLWATAVLTCYGNLIKVDSRRLIAQIPVVLEYASHFINDLTSPAFAAAARMIKKWIKYLPFTIHPHIAPFLSHFASVFDAAPDPNAMLIECNREVYGAIRRNCMACLALAAREIPSLSADISPRLWALLLFEQGEFFADTVTVLTAAGPLFVDNGYDQKPTLFHLLSLIKSEESEAVLIIYLEGIREIVWHNSRSFVLEHMDRLTSSLVSAIEGQFHGFVTGRVVPRIPLALRRAIGRALAVVIDQVREAIGAFLPDLYDRLANSLRDSTLIGDAGHATIVMVCAKICRYCPGNSDLARRTLEHACTAWPAAADREAKVCLMIAFTALFDGNNEALAGMREAVTGSVLSMVSEAPDWDREIRSFGVTFLASSLVLTGLDSDEDVRGWTSLILRHLRVRPNSENLPWVADFVADAARKWPELAAEKVPGVAAVLFASDRIVTGMARQETIEFLLSQIVEIERDQLQQLCRYNESMFSRLERNLSRLTSALGKG
jgi:hypothetical protein